jgi:hypothetical protein
MDDRHAGKLLDELVTGVDIATLASAEAEVMQADALLDEALAAMFRRRGGNADRRAPADAVQVALELHHRLQAEEIEQRLVEGEAGVVVADGQEDVCDTVDLHRGSVLPAKT